MVPRVVLKLIKHFARSNSGSGLQLETLTRQILLDQTLRAGPGCSDIDGLILQVFVLLGELVHLLLSTLQLLKESGEHAHH